MLLKVNETIKKYNMLDTGEQVIVALSGGADSVSLVLALKKLGYEVKAVHVNHHLRGEESDRDMRFCEKLCEKYNVPLDVYHVDVLEHSNKTGLSTETAARELRYEAFEKYENSKVATAHNLNDCLETTLFNMTRGSGLKGACGIPPVRDNFIRPLVDTTRDEILKFLDKENQSFVSDSSNDCDDYSRNKIRHNVVPGLLKINENLFENYKRFRDNLIEDSAYLDELSKNAFNEVKLQRKSQYDTVKLNTLSTPVKHRVFGEILKENGVEISKERVLELERICKDEGKINPKGNTFFVCKNGILKCLDENINSENFVKSVKFNENSPHYEIFSRTVRLMVEDIDNVNKNFTNNVLDYDKIIGTAILRGRKEGDKIQLVNRDFTSTVKKLFSSLFDEETRKNRLLLADDEGVVFVEGAGCAERCKIDKTTKRVLVFCEN